MTRKVITREELASWMTAELRKIDGCEECSVGQVNLLQQLDADGCNWSDSLVIRTGGVPQDYFRPHLDKIVAKARASFNVQ